MSVCLPTKQPQQVWSAVHLRHRHFWMFSQDLCVLRPLELIEQLSAQHDIEILPDPCYHLVYRVLSVLGVNTQTWQRYADKCKFDITAFNYYTSYRLIK